MKGLLLLLLAAALCVGAAGECSRRRLLARPTSLGTLIPPEQPAQQPAGQAVQPAGPPAQEPASRQPPAQESATRQPPAQEPATQSPSPPAAKSPSELSGGGCPDAAANLKRHNDERAKTGAPPLAWSPDLADAAQEWADTCQLQSSGQGYGENQSSGSSWRTCSAAMPLWLGGRDRFQAGETPPSDALAWTQIVWKGSKEVGCGLAQCPGKGGVVVCFYDPPGNINGRFDANVGGSGQAAPNTAATAG